MLLDNNWYVCVEESNYTREFRNIHAEKGFELSIPVFRQLDSGELHPSAIEHVLISVFYVNVTNLFYKAYAKMGFISFFLFVYFYVFSHSLFPGLFFR